MELRKLQRTVIDAIEDIKGQDIQVFDTTGLTGLFDRVILVSGTSNRHTRSVASHVVDKVKAAGGDVISVEGTDTGEWVLIDLADIVVHVMQPAIRSYYHLEELWGGKPVRVKLGAGSTAHPVPPTPRPLPAEIEPPRVRSPRPARGGASRGA